ncbi:MAG: hypothetical protein ACJ700_02950, partial [Nitrososphaera sp.]
MFKIGNNNQQRKTRRSLLSIGTIFVMAGLFLVTSSSLTTTTTSALAQSSVPQSMQATQNAALQDVTSDETNAGYTKFTSRWSPVITADPNTLTALFADCEPGEYAVSGQHMFETRNLDEIHSFALALPNNFMTWMTIVYNWGDSPLDASGGVICADDIGAATTSTTNNDLDDDTQKTIQNTVN